MHSSKKLLPISNKYKTIKHTIGVLDKQECPLAGKVHEWSLCLIDMSTSASRVIGMENYGF